ncbi:hypothetical protein ABQE44_25340 [Mycolicibacterium sp. XJ2546]
MTNVTPDRGLCVPLQFQQTLPPAAQASLATSALRAVAGASGIVSWSDFALLHRR